MIVSFPFPLPQDLPFSLVHILTPSLPLLQHLKHTNALLPLPSDSQFLFLLNFFSFTYSVVPLQTGALFLFPITSSLFHPTSFIFYTSYRFSFFVSSVPFSRPSHTIQSSIIFPPFIKNSVLFSSLLHFPDTHFTLSNYRFFPSRPIPTIVS